MSETCICPLCESAGAGAIESARYFLCAVCDLRFLLPAARLTPEVEKSRYDLHQNNSADLAYRKFLSPLLQAVQNKLAPAAHGLDFGCGPEPLLAQMFEESGFKMALYDPFFKPAREPLTASYDFVVACEVAEHFFTPNVEFRRLFGLLKPGGWLGVQTRFVEPTTVFANWYYRRDPTHVVFYSRRTFQWIARQLGLTALTYSGDAIVLMQRPFDGRNLCTQ